MCRDLRVKLHLKMHNLRIYSRQHVNSFPNGNNTITAEKEKKNNLITQQVSAVSNNTISETNSLHWISEYAAPCELLQKKVGQIRHRFKLQTSEAVPTTLLHNT